MSFNVREIQYLNRDYCTAFSKPLVYLHYVDHANKYPNAAYQHVLKKEPFSDKTTDDSIVDEFKNYEKSIVNVSSKCRLMSFIKDFQLEYPNIIDDMQVYPNYTVEIVDISNRANSTPDLGIVWEINRIAPAMCGMLFENIISECLEIKWRPCDLSSVISSDKSNITPQTLAGIIERNFIKRSYMRNDCHVKINNKKFAYVGDEKLDAKHFVSYWHYIVFMSLCHFMKRDLTGNDVENALNILDYIKEHFEDIDDYFDCMSHSTFVENFSKDTNIRHGEIVRTEHLHGECDFVSNESIVDIKCYKEECLDDWFGQLWLYEKLFGPHKNLWIVNVYNNKIYKFSYDRQK